VRGSALFVQARAKGAGVKTIIHPPLHRQAHYRLTLRARASRAVDIHVRVKTPGRRTLAAQAFALKPGAWQTRTRRITVKHADRVEKGTPLTLELACAGKAGMWLDRCSLVPTDAMKGWDREVVGRMKWVDLPLLRFPGGNFVSGYHWRDGVGPLDGRPILPNPAWPIVEWNEVGTDDWLNLCEIVGCEPLICVNAGNGTPEEAAAWVEYCNGSARTPMGALRAANGHPKPYNVRLWEIGNELYGGWQIGHTAAQGYAERYLVFRKAMLDVDPTINIIANGHTAAWNKALVEHAGGAVRSLSVHTLENGGRFSRDDEPTAVYMEHMAYVAEYGKRLRTLAAPMREARLKPKLAITELSIFTNMPELPHMDNLSEALHYSGIVNAAIRSKGLVELITHSALINHSAGMTKTRGVVYMHPVWLALHLYSVQPGVQPVKLDVKGPTFSTEGKWFDKVASAPLIDAVALLDKKDSALTVFVANRDPCNAVSAELTVDSFRAAGRAQVSVITGDSVLARNMWTDPEAVTIDRRYAGMGRWPLRLDLPPLSLTRLIIRKRRPLQREVR
ncbi:alpha-L-arabinofuranosidase C-terminal domain-containing protein, partial [Verrucomicrobiota bacterium]